MLKTFLSIRFYGQDITRLSSLSSGLMDMLAKMRVLLAQASSEVMERTLFFGSCLHRQSTENPSAGINTIFGDLLCLGNRGLGGIRRGAGSVAI